MDKYVIISFISVVIFFICRELMCWYWKINKMIKFLESIDRKLSIISGDPPVPNIEESFITDKFKIKS